MASAMYKSLDLLIDCVAIICTFLLPFGRNTVEGFDSYVIEQWGKLRAEKQQNRYGLRKNAKGCNRGIQILGDLRWKITRF
jgi:hypothetical protein